MAEETNSTAAVALNLTDLTQFLNTFQTHHPQLFQSDQKQSTSPSRRPTDFKSDQENYSSSDSYCPASPSRRPTDFKNDQENSSSDYCPASPSSTYFKSGQENSSSDYCPASPSTYFKNDQENCSSSDSYCPASPSRRPTYFKNDQENCSSSDSYCPASQSVTEQEFTAAPSLPINRAPIRYRPASPTEQSLRATVSRFRPRERNKFGIPETQYKRKREEIYYDERNKKGSIPRKVHSKFTWIRNFNNWAKCVLIENTIRKLQQSRRDGDYEDPPNWTVVDFGCGTGGDLLKYNGYHVNQYIGIDISSVSIQNAQRRYLSLKQNRRIDYDGRFYVHDLTNALPLEIYPTNLADIVSCQFCLHYFFESKATLEGLLYNVATMLKPGGYFIGIVPDASVIVSRIRRSVKSNPIIGNSLYCLQPSSTRSASKFKSSKSMRGLGLQYNIELSSSDSDILFAKCQEYLVPRPILEKQAARCNLRLVQWENLQKLFHTSLQDDSSRHLMKTMGIVLPNEKMKSKDKVTYDEWEVLHLYSVFCFVNDSSGPETVAE